MAQAGCISTKEAAERLQVHARTVRNWIDTFQEYIGPNWNERGHYVLSEESFSRLLDIKKRLNDSNKTLKQVREELIQEGKISLSQPPSTAEPTRLDTETTEKMFHHLLETIDNVGDLVEELYERMERMETHMVGLFESLEEMEQKVLTVSYDSVSANEVQHMFDEIRKKQDQLRIELRNVSFTQRLTAATSEYGLLPRRQKKSRFFGLL
ncbi:MerR family transcriptional regulator [Laceyella putida]|uniref:MerR family transcriptional regulator n=1 Tax=Laceyella putida TaxID=110101 RepID=A0ABW2RFF2_9BACL